MIVKIRFVIMAVNKIKLGIKGVIINVILVISARRMEMIVIILNLLLAILIVKNVLKIATGTWCVIKNVNLNAKQDNV